jgi:hypothetical protein
MKMETSLFGFSKKQTSIPSIYDAKDRPIPEGYSRTPARQRIELEFTQLVHESALAESAEGSIKCPAIRAREIFVDYSLLAA